jgi:hypothetical protein
MKTAKELANEIMQMFDEHNISKMQIYEILEIVKKRLLK